MVKNSIRVSGVIVLTAIYYFGVSIATTSLSHAHFQKTEQERYFSNYSSNLFFHTSQTKASFDNFTCFTTPAFKNITAGLWAIAEAKEQIFKAAFSQYTSFTGKILINYRKSDIIFPFHYFW